MPTGVALLGEKNIIYKREKLQERSLRIIHDTCEQSYEELLKMNSSITSLLHRMKLLTLEMY